MAGASEPITELLGRWKAGDEESFRLCVPMVYRELRRLAHYHLRHERPGHTLQTTALVHEAYLCLAKHEQIAFANRAQFFAVCARLMREILVQHARRRKAAKRDGGQQVSLDSAVEIFGRPGIDMVALDDALNDLAKLDLQQSRIVDLRFFGGLSIEETADVLGIAPATVKRHWSTARLWLRRQMTRTRHDA